MREHRVDMGARCAGSWSDAMPLLASHGPMTTVPGQLVKNGTITQPQASAVTSAFTQQMRLHWGDSPAMRGYGPGMVGGWHMGWAN